RLRGCAKGKLHVERAAQAWACASYGDSSAVQLDQALDQRQADAQATLGAIEPAVGLGEQVEHMRQQVRGDTHAVVLHPDARPSIEPCQGQHDFAAFLGELRGVAEQVADDLYQTHRVAIDGE